MTQEYRYIGKATPRVDAEESASDAEAATEAARLSAAAGRPVHIGWNRPEDFQHGFLRPPTHHVFKGVLNGQRITALEHQQASGAVAFPFLSGMFKAILGADFGAWRGAKISS